ncbi:hypothetical protein Clacol_002694 [Clathrus columnatus]|uniref:Uncharacterized protein n=1 Tax=Clathrus columnatus TaxID=1419009 RepID=A0AAV5A1E6_9AGAM|nr:hypothetical protein Clacol_002694 [Clathrus columnatus]
MSDSVPRTPITPYPGADTTAVKELLTMMKSTLGTLGSTFEALNDQSGRITTLGPTDSSQQISSLRRQIRRQDKKQDERVMEVKHMIKDVLKDHIANDMRLEAQIEEQIRAEIALQVRQEVTAQIVEHLPISLQEQAEQSKRQLNDVKLSLVNSCSSYSNGCREARRANSGLRANNLDDPLARVLKPNGTESAMFPTDLRTLFGYDSNTALELVREFGLKEHDSRERNLNRFMAFIGIPFHLIPVPALTDAGPTNALHLNV